jgi:ribosome-binding factor A
MANPRSKARLEARIHERVAYCLEFEIHDPRSAFLTVTKVELSNDLSVAHVFYSVYGTDSDKSRVSHMLADATGFVRGKVGGVLRVRRIPRIAFVYDDSIERAARVDQAIREALERDRAINPAAHEGIDLTPPEPSEAALIDQEYLDFLKAKEAEERGEAEETP